MACMCALIARLLMAIIWIGAGVNKFQNPQPVIRIASASINNFDTWISKDLQIGQIPEKNLIHENMNHIIMGIAGVQILGGLFLVTGYKLGAFMLTFLVIPLTVFVHNPWYSYWNAKERIVQSKLTVINLLIYGSLLMAFGRNSRKMVAGKLANFS